MKKEHCIIIRFKYQKNDGDMAKLVDATDLIGLSFGLSPATSATLVFSCQDWVWNPEQTAGDKPEEGEDDVKSSCPLCPGRHMFRYV